MPTRTPQDTRLPTALLLLGMVGLVASGLGLFPAVPAWAWLVVLALGWLHPLVRRRSGARRFDAAERRRNERARRNMRIASRAAKRAQGRIERRVDGLENLVKAGLQPDEVATLRESIVNFAGDLQLMKEKVVRLMQDRNERGLGRMVGGDDGDLG